MKKRTLAALALMGISLSLFGQNNQPTGADQQAFYQMLKPEAQKKFLELDSEHRRAAMEIYQSDCKAENQCRGHREQAVDEQYNNQMLQRRQLNNGM